MEDTDSDILGLGFLITSSIMWISNRGHVFCVRGIRLHPTVVFSNVLMKKKRQSNRKTSEWSKSDCSVRGRYQQRYLVYYKRYRNEFLQRGIWSETVSSDEIECVDAKPATWGSKNIWFVKKWLFGTWKIPNNHFLTNQMFFDSHVAGFASTHSKTRHSDVIWCRKRDRREFTASDYIRMACFRMCWCKTSDMRIEKHLICQKVIVRYMEDTDSDILGLGFLITSSIMWISNRGHVFCVRGIRLHPTVVFSNVLMKKKRQSNRKTSEWSKSDCSVRGRYQQRYLVYYKRYRNEFLQRRIWSETVSSDEIWAGYCKKHWSYSRSYNLRQVNY